MRLHSFTFQPEGTLVDSDYGPYAELTGIADLHIGAGTFNEKKALRHKKYILDSPDRKAIDLGDHVENAIVGSPPGAIYDQKLSPSEQRAYAREYYEDLRGRVLAVVSSNHSARSKKAADISPDELLIAQLGCAYFIVGILSITVGDSRRGQNYNIWVKHKVGNCSSAKAIIGKLEAKSMRTQGCDVYWCAHSHQFVHHAQVATLPDPRHGKVKHLTQHLCCSDSFMEYDDSYAEEGYERPLPGQVSLRLYRDVHRVEVVQLVY